MKGKLFAIPKGFVQAKVLLVAVEEGCTQKLPWRCEFQESLRIDYHRYKSASLACRVKLAIELVHMKGLQPIVALRNHPKGPLPQNVVFIRVGDRLIEAFWKPAMKPWPHTLKPTINH